MVNMETLLCAKMFSMETFDQWIITELKKRNWNQNELAKRAGIAHGTVSNIINNNKGVGESSLRAIARAFKYPPEIVFRAAGLLPQVQQSSETEEKLLYLFTELSDEQRGMVLEYMQFLLSKNK
jgi:transcriptional regulator with XRE-family HTH domain